MTLKSNVSSLVSKMKTPSFLSNPGDSALTKRIKRLPKLARWAVPLVLFLAAAGGYAYYTLVYLPAQTSTTEAAMQTAIVRQGDLVIYASGTGTLISASQTDLAFKTGGEVQKIYFEVGDTVKAGDLLAEVDDSAGQLALTQAQRTLRELTSPSAIADAQIAMADAETEIASAKSHLEYVLGPNIVYWETQVAEAQTALDQVQAAADKAPSDKEAQTALQKARDTLAYMQDKLSGAWLSYEAIYVPNHFTTFDRSTGKKSISAPSDAEILSARADLASAEATLQEAQYLYAALTGGDVPEDATGSGLTELEQAEADLQSAQDDLEGTKLYAPIDGTIMSIDTSAGDTASSGTIVISLADLTQPYLDLYLDESDWDNVRPGYEVEVTFDILPEKTFSGVVTQVDPGLYTSNGSTAVHAVVQLTNIDKASFNLPLSTTASVDVIGGRAAQAILVPIEALHQAGDQYTVFVVDNGTPTLRVVQVGLQDSLYAQITSGLEAGEVVTTGITETK
jgi:RND family efflux transporter MFP subunit